LLGFVFVIAIVVAIVTFALQTIYIFDIVKVVLEQLFGLCQKE